MQIFKHKSLGLHNTKKPLRKRREALGLNRIIILGSSLYVLCLFWVQENKLVIEHIQPDLTVLINFACQNLF